MDSVKEYVELVKAPWGRMFYDLVFTQLDIPQTPKLKILDFGSGLGVTANHYAAWHDVTAIEPNEEMIENSHKENLYTQVHGSIEKITSMKDLTKRGKNSPGSTSGGMNCRLKTESEKRLDKPCFL